MTPISTEVQKKFSTGFYMAVSTLMLMAMTGTCFADTYNFYFDKKKKGHVEQPEAQEESSEAEGTETSPAPTTASPAPQSSVAPGTSPIIIHNNVNVPNTYPSPPAPVISPAPEPPAAENDAHGALNARVEMPVFKRRPQWKFGLSAMAFAERSHSGAVSDTSQLYNTGQYTDYDYGSSTSSRKAGAVVSMGYRFAPAFGMNFYIGEGSGSRVFAGADAEWVPVRLDVGSFDLIELGGILGVSTLTPPGSSNTTMAHLGARLNLNLGPAFSVTSSARVNAAYAMAELGIAVNL